MTQSTILIVTAILLAAALVLSWVRRFNGACVRNVLSLPLSDDVAQAREDLRQLTAEAQRFNGELLAARRNVDAVAAATARARKEQSEGYNVKFTPLPVKTPKQTDRQPAKKQPQRKR